MQAIFNQAIELVLAENQRVLQAIAYSEVERLAQKIMDVERIFVIGEGRSGLAIRMAAMRLMHLFRAPGLCRGRNNNTIDPLHQFSRPLSNAPWAAIER